MTDIWDEKPEFPGMAEVEEYLMYLDAWLEQVKDYYDVYVKQYRNMVEHALELTDVLTAVEGVFDEMYEDYMNSRTTPLVSNYIPKFREALTHSPFTTNSEESE